MNEHLHFKFNTSFMGRGNKSIQMKTSHRHLPQVTDKFYHKKLKIVYKTCLPVGIAGDLRGSLRPLPFDNKEGLLKSRF
jgi:hypothetical protein